MVAVTLYNAAGDVAYRERFRNNVTIVSNLPSGWSLADRSQCEWIKQFPQVTLHGKPLAHHFNREGDEVIYGSKQAFFDGMAIANNSHTSEHIRITFYNGCAR